MKTTRRANARENKDGSALLWEGVRTPLNFRAEEKIIFVRKKIIFCAEENYFSCGRKLFFVRKKIYFRAEENLSKSETFITHLLITN